MDSQKSFFLVHIKMEILKTQISTVVATKFFHFLKKYIIVKSLYKLNLTLSNMQHIVYWFLSYTFQYYVQIPHDKLLLNLAQVHSKIVSLSLLSLRRRPPSLTILLIEEFV